MVNVEWACSMLSLAIVFEVHTVGYYSPLTTQDLFRFAFQ
jgi:hypothetical protein